MRPRPLLLLKLRANVWGGVQTMQMRGHTTEWTLKWEGLGGCSKECLGEGEERKGGGL